MNLIFNCIKKLFNSFKLNLHSLMMLFLVVSFTGCARPKYYEKSQSQNDVEELSQDQLKKWSFYELNNLTDILQPESNINSAQKIKLKISWNLEQNSNLSSQKYYSADVSFFALNDFNFPQLIQADNYELKVKLWMPSMDHGSVPTKIQKISEGHYQVSQIYFIMAGDWEVRFYVRELSTGREQMISQSVFLND